MTKKRPQSRFLTPLYSLNQNIDVLLLEDSMCRFLIKMRIILSSFSMPCGSSNKRVLQLEEAFGKC